MSPRKHLLQVQRKLYSRLRQTAAQAFGTSSSTLQKYLKEYQEDFRGWAVTITPSTFVHAVSRGSAAIVGDYHTLPQAQRTLVRLAQSLHPKLKTDGRRLVIALELLPSDLERVVKKYFDGEMNESRFLQLIQYAKRWGFPWENYRPIFQWARENGAEVIGLNTPGGELGVTLQKRDAWAAKRISVAMSDASVFVLALIGDLHLGSSHLPRALREELARRGIKRRFSTVHQNQEGLYWRLAERKTGPGSGIVRMKPGVFCVVNSSPWKKLQSYLQWTEQEPTSLHAQLGAPRLKQESTETDPEQSVKELAQSLWEFLKAPGSVGDDFEVLWLDSLRLWNRMKSVYSTEPPHLKLTYQLCREFPSQFLADKRWLVFRELTSDQLAVQSALLVYACLSGWRGKVTLTKDLSAQVWVEAMGYLGSKILNPHRRTPSLKEYERLVRPWGRRPPAFPPEPLEVQVAREVLRVVRAGKLDPQVAGPTLLHFHVRRKVSHLVGEALYRSYVAGKVTNARLLDLFRTHPSKQVAELTRILRFSTQKASPRQALRVAA